MTSPPVFRFDNSYFAELEGLYAPWNGAEVPDPTIVKLNRELAHELGIDAERIDSPVGAAFLAGSESPEGAAPLAQAYAGHQFGAFVPQLGDGRALLVGELIDRNGQRRDLHLKGSGRTPFSRGGDGKAVLGPVLREYLIGEFMHAVGVPTTRSLAAVTTGELVLREGPQPGAVLARVASSHIRVGTFQLFAARGDDEKLGRLADYTIRRHDPHLAESEEPYLQLLRALIDRQASLVAKWMGLGFVHGVMNTDNTTISGETIDYGPCAFIDRFDPSAVFSSIDRHGRYAYAQQPQIAQWNLARFAETLLKLIDPTNTEQAIASATAALDEYPQIYEQYWSGEMSAKLGLERLEATEHTLVDGLLDGMAKSGVDFTQLFRSLSSVLRGDDAHFAELTGKDEALEEWKTRWLARHESEETEALVRADDMDRVNPVYIPRNHKVEEALQAATAGDLAPFEVLHGLLDDPYTAVDGRDDYAEPAPSDFGCYTTYCGT